MLDLTASRPVRVPSKPLRTQWLGTFLSVKYSTLFSKVLFCCSSGCNLSRNNKSPRVSFPRLRTPCTFSASKVPLLHRPGAPVWRASPKITPYRCNPRRHLYRNSPSFHLSTSARAKSFCPSFKEDPSFNTLPARLVWSLTPSL